MLLADRLAHMWALELVEKLDQVQLDVLLAEGLAHMWASQLVEKLEMVLADMWAVLWAV